MVLLTDILIVLLLIAVIALVVYLILFLIKVSKSIEAMERDVHQLSQKSLPILEDLNETIQKVNEIADQAQNKFDEVNNAFDSIKSIFNKFVPQKKSHQKTGDVKNPVVDLIKKFQAISKGVSTFWNSYKTNN